MPCRWNFAAVYGQLTKIEEGICADLLGEGPATLILWPTCLRVEVPGGLREVELGVIASFSTWWHCLAHWGLISVGGLMMKMVSLVYRTGSLHPHRHEISYPSCVPASVSSHLLLVSKLSIYLPGCFITSRLCFKTSQFREHCSSDHSNLRGEGLITLWLVLACPRKWSSTGQHRGCIAL